MGSGGQEQTKKKKKINVARAVNAAEKRTRSEYMGSPYTRIDNKIYLYIIIINQWVVREKHVSSLATNMPQRQVGKNKKLN